MNAKRYCDQCRWPLPSEEAVTCSNCGARQELAFRKGERIGKHYVVERVLGQGGMGQVVKASHDLTGQVVAIKTLSPHLAEDPGLRKRFLQEARTLAAFDHPNLIPLYTFIEEHGRFFLVMQFIDGQDLDSLFRYHGGLAHRITLPIFVQALDGLAYAHRHGVIHRDIKPANILVTQDGRVKLTDFGIARIVGGMRLTKIGAPVGTVFYMAPEQVQGAEAEPRTDIYAMGVSLFEVLTGRLPFEGDDYTVRKGHVEAPSPDPRVFQHDIPPELVHMIQRAMAKRPEDRYQTAEAFRDALASLDISLSAQEALRELFYEKTTQQELPAGPPPPPQASSLPQPPPNPNPPAKRPPSPTSPAHLASQSSLPAIPTKLAPPPALPVAPSLSKAPAGFANHSAAAQGAFVGPPRPPQPPPQNQPPRKPPPQALPAPVSPLPTKSIQGPPLTQSRNPSSERSYRPAQSSLPPNATTSRLNLPSLTQKKPRSSGVLPKFVVNEEYPSSIIGRDGAEMILIRAGTFYFGSHDQEVDARPLREIYLDAYYIDRYPVTNDLYLRFLQETGYPPPPHWWDPRTTHGQYFPTEQLQHPVTNLRYEDGLAYCRWAGKRLPTEAEWEKAARAQDMRLFPWGDQWVEGLANFGRPSTTPVSAFPQGQSSTGVFDLLGNVWEWTADWYASDSYLHIPDRNPTGAPRGQFRVIRGGSHSDRSGSVTLVTRGFRPPDLPGASLGFRCAMEVLDTEIDSAL